MNISGLPTLGLMMSVLITAAAIAAAQPDAQPQLVTAQLVSDIATIQPGSSFTLGVHLRIEDGWHIYWQNPGDSGLPTKITFHLPQGLQLVELQWPTPHRWVQPGDIIGYGYEHEVMFIAQIHADATFDPAKPVEISADVSWLVCKDLCLPGKATLTYQFPVAVPQGFTLTSDIANWQAAIPLTPQQAGVVQDIETTGVVGEPVTVKIHWNQDIDAIDWFPAPVANLEVGEVRIVTEGRTTLIHFTPRLLTGAALDRDTLDSVLSWRPAGDTTGRQRGLNIQIPLR